MGKMEMEIISTLEEKLTCALSRESKLLAENEDLRKCHESELGVCFQHCDEVNELQAKIGLLQTTLRTAKTALSEIIEKEALVCPEDVGCVEYIEQLQAERDQLAVDFNYAHEKMRQLQAELDPIREWYGSGTEGNRPDVEVLHSAIADLQDDRQAVLVLHEDKANLKAELDKWKPKAVNGIEAYREVKK